ncbi:MAG: penicillin-binding transpeptidase domain-containing protein [Edaphocola sp.]
MNKHFLTKANLLCCAVAALGILGSCRNVRIKEHDEWKQYFDKYGVEGCFEFYDNNKETAHYCNKEECAERVSPASTFKILTALIALETAVAPDEQLTIRWDGIPRKAAWDKDLTMAEAFKASSVPYFQEIARRIGREKMQHYLDTIQYGNKQIGTAIDSFWLNGTLLVSPDEQVGFIKRLYHAELPFSERTQRIVRGMMQQTATDNYKLYYKTGWNKNLLWVVGYVEKFNNLKNVETGKMEAIPHPYFFALKFNAKDTTQDLRKVRLDLLNDLLKDNGLDK